MHSFVNCLHAGLVEACRNPQDPNTESMPFQLGWLERDVAALFCGSPADKKTARATLEKYIHRGRCILNARDHNARLSAYDLQIIADGNDLRAANGLPPTFEVLS